MTMRERRALIEIPRNSDFAERTAGYSSRPTPVRAATAGRSMCRVMQKGNRARRKSMYWATPSRRLGISVGRESQPERGRSRHFRVDARGTWPGTPLGTADDEKAIRYRTRLGPETDGQGRTRGSLRN